MSKLLSDPHKMLIRLVGLNAFFDLITIPLWAILPMLPTYGLSQSGSTLTVNNTIAIADAAVAVAVFAIAVFGIMKKRKWGSMLAIGGTIAQRIIGAFMFSLNVGMIVEIAWSLLIVYFAYKELKTLPKISNPQTIVESIIGS